MRPVVARFFNLDHGTALPASGRLACSGCSFVHHDNPFPGVSVINVVSNVIRPHLESLVIVLLAQTLPEDPVAGDDITDVAWAGEELTIDAARAPQQFGNTYTKYR